MTSNTISGSMPPIKEEISCNERIVQVKPPKKPMQTQMESMRSRPGYQSSSSDEDEAIVKIERSPGDTNSNEFSSNQRQKLIAKPYASSKPI